MARVVKAQARKGRTPILQDPFKATIAQCIRDEVVGHEGNADTINRGIGHQWLVSQGEGAGDVNLFDAAVALKFPIIDRAALKAETNTVMAVKILWGRRTATGGEVCRRGDCRKAYAINERNGHHVLRYGLRQPDARIEPLRDDVAKPPIADDFKVNLGIGAQEARENGPQDHTDRAFAGVDSHGSAGNLAQIIDFSHGFFNGRHCRPQLCREPFPRLGQGDAAGRAIEQAYAQTLLEGLHRMADR